MRTFDTLRQATREASKLEAKAPGRCFAVLGHPSRPRKFVIGIMAARVLLIGYVGDGTWNKSRQVNQAKGTKRRR